MATFYDKKSKTWSGPTVLYPFTKNTTLGQVLLMNMLKNPNQIAQISDDDGVELTNNDLRLLSIRAAQNYIKLGLKEKDVIGFIAINSTYLTPLLIGGFFTGIVVSLLDPNTVKDDVTTLFEKTQPKIIFCDSHRIAEVQKALKQLSFKPKLYTLIEKVPGFSFAQEVLQETGEEDEFQIKDMGDSTKLVAAILYSSGTTGTPKPVSISHSICLYCLLMEKTDTSTVVWHMSSVYWISSFMTMNLCLASSKIRLVAAKSITSEYIVEMIEKYKISHCFISPPATSNLARSEVIKTADLSSLEAFMTGGSNIPEYLIEKLHGYLPNGIVMVIYAMTETGIVVATSNSNFGNFKSTGKLFPNMTVKIVDDVGEKLGEEEKGEVIVKPPSQFMGYYKNPQATKEAFDENMWYKTGDIGFFDKEGFLYLVDRKKDVFKYMSNIISPSKIEDVINKIEGVRFACVLGIPDESKINELPAVAIIKKEGSVLSEQDVISRVAEEFNGYHDFMQLRGGVYFFDKLPMTTTGKIKKMELRKVVIKMHEDKNFKI